jgi:hypothetical protein
VLQYKYTNQPKGASKLKYEIRLIDRGNPLSVEVTANGESHALALAKRQFPHASFITVVNEFAGAGHDLVWSPA